MRSCSFKRVSSFDASIPATSPPRAFVWAIWASRISSVSFKSICSLSCFSSVSVCTRRCSLSPTESARRFSSPCCAIRLSGTTFFAFWRARMRPETRISSVGLSLNRSGERVPSRLDLPTMISLVSRERRACKISRRPYSSLRSKRACSVASRSEARSFDRSSTAATSCCDSPTVAIFVRPSADFFACKERPCTRNAASLSSKSSSSGFKFLICSMVEAISLFTAARASRQSSSVVTALTCSPSFWLTFVKVPSQSIYSR